MKHLRTGFFYVFARQLLRMMEEGERGGVMLMYEQIIPSRFLTCLICMRA